MKAAMKKDDPAEPVNISGSSVPTVAGGDLTYSYDTLGQDKELTVSLEAEALPNIETPIAKGDKVGRLTLVVDGRKTKGVALYAAQAVEKSPIATITNMGSASKNPLGAVAIGAGVLGVVGLGVLLGTSTKNSRRSRRRQSPKGGGTDHRRTR
jgi:Penicillin-binding protein 5, C-terminal domain